MPAPTNLRFQYAQMRLPKLQNVAAKDLWHPPHRTREQAVAVAGGWVAAGVWV